MSIRAGLALAVVLGAAVGCASVASAAEKTVVLNGCPTQGSPTFCTMMKGAGGNYSVSFADPAVPIGKNIRLEGTVTDKMSPCGGIGLEHIKWTSIKGGCPKAK